ncbi:MAG: twin-arginine translocase TatA/TatE family subunit [Alphaproteobacteria bacterium]|nr:twin-arginine translocase TatA/TatE family subunit [Alphaproteobacteria bacterium]
MGTFSIWHWVIVLVVVLVLFGGGGKLSRLMGDAARGITAFKKGLKENSPDGDDEKKTIDAEAAEPSANTSSKDETAKS